MLMVSIFCAPWLLGIAWVVRRHGLDLLIPRDGLPPSFGDLQQHS